MGKIKNTLPTSFSYVGDLMLQLVRFVLGLFFNQSSYESVSKSLSNNVLHFSYCDIVNEVLLLKI